MIYYYNSNGQSLVYSLEKSDIHINYPTKKRVAFKIPIGELIACHKSLHIPNIRTYYALSTVWAGIAESMIDIIKKFSGKRYGQKLLKGFAAYAKGPDDESMLKDKAYVYARAANENGIFAETMIKTPEPYYFTVLIALKIIDNILTGNYSGAITPVEAFGSSIIFDVDGVEYV